MQATVMHLDLQLKGKVENSSIGNSSPKNSGTTSSSTSKGSKERTKATTNGPIETGSINSSNSSKT